RPDPDDVLAPPLLRRQRDRRLPGAQRLEPGEQVLHLGHGEAGADPADIAQLAAFLGIRQEQRADAARRLRRGVADDGELLALAALDLEPAATARLLVGAVGALGDDA